MANNIIGNHDGDKGGNDTYNIPGRGINIPKDIIVNEVESGQHPNFTTTVINNETYVKAKPNPQTKDNVNR